MNSGWGESNLSSVLKKNFHVSDSRGRCCALLYPHLRPDILRLIRGKLVYCVWRTKKRAESCHRRVIIFELRNIKKWNLKSPPVFGKQKRGAREVKCGETREAERAHIYATDEKIRRHAKWNCARKAEETARRSSSTTAAKTKLSNFLNCSSTISILIWYTRPPIGARQHRPDEWNVFFTHFFFFAIVSEVCLFLAEERIESLTRRVARHNAG